MSFSEDTDVLTARGWVSWGSVVHGDALATLSAAGTIEFQTPTHLVAYTHRGRMIAFEGSGVDLMLTPNHLMWVSPMAGAKARAERRFAFITAEEAHRRAHRYHTWGLWEGGTDCGWSDDEIFLMGMLFGRGVFYNGYVVEVRVAAYKRLRMVWDLVERLGFPRRKRRFFLVESNPRFREVLDAAMASDGIPVSILRTWSRANLERLLDGVLFAAAIRKDHSSKLLIKHPSEKRIDSIHHLLVMAGRSGYRDGITYDEGRLMIQYLKHQLVVYAENRSPELNRKRSTRPHQSRIIDGWQGRVITVTVPNDRVFVRRNGHVVWCGATSGS